MKNNVIFNKSLEEYNKKYHKRREHLLCYTNEEVINYDRKHGHYRYEYSKRDYEYDKHLLKGRNWWCIKGRYYEVPKAPSFTWFRNLKPSIQAISIAIPSLAIVGGVTAAVLVNVNKNTDQPAPIKPYVKTEDDLIVDGWNKDIEEVTTIKTLFDAVKYFKDETNIDLEETKAKDSTKEYAFDIDNKEFLVLNKSGSIAYTPKPIKAKSSVFRFRENYVYDETITNPSNVYGTYITKKTINSNINKNVLLNHTFNESDTLSFNTSLDVGFNNQYSLKFVPQSDFKPVIVTNRNDLEINGAASDVTHYGVATALTVTKLEGTYNERGSVDGEVRLKDKVTFNLAPECSVNTIVVENDDVKVKTEEDSYVGTIAKTENVTTELSDITAGSAEETIQHEETEPAPEEEDRDFSGGYGREDSPYSISKAEDLVELAEKVNVESSEYVGDIYYRVTKDIDLLGVANFTPIGTSSYPFKGHFDGCNFTISNLKISVVEESGNPKSNIGLFGYTSGDANELYKNKEDIYNDQGFYEDNIKEEKYTCVIKNLNIEHAEISVDVGTTYKHKQAAAFIGLAHNTRVDNLHFLSGSITGNKAGGGVVGSSEDSVVINCSTTNEVTVKGAEYNNGGVVGCMSYTSGLQVNGNGVFNCTNGATVMNLNKKTNNSGYGGGVVGYASGSGQPKDTSHEGPHRGNHIIGCVNNGTVSTNDEDTTKKCQNLGGIVGYGGAAIELVANCTNNGTIINKSTDPLIGSVGGGMGGITSFTSGIFINCVNNGLLDGKCDFKAGLISQRSNNGHFPFKIIGGANTGTLTTEGVTFCSKIVCGIYADTEISDLTFEDTDDFANSIGFRQYDYPSSYYTATFKNINVKNPSGNYVIRDDIEYLSINSDKKLFDTFTMHPNLKLVVIDAPMGNVTLSSAPSCNITIISDNTEVTVPSGVTINNLYVGGNNSSVINNGTVNCVTLQGKANKLVNNETGVINAGVSISGVKDYTKQTEITNYGTIQKNTTAQGTHLLSVSGDYEGTIVNNVTLNNYGKIEYTSTNPNYWLLMYSFGHFEYNGYAGSEMSLVNSVNPLAKYQDATVTYNHQVAKGAKAAAAYTKDGSPVDWITLKGNGVSVNEIQ